MGPERARRRVNNTLHQWTVNKHHPVPPGGWTERQGRAMMGIPDLFREPTLLVQLAKKRSHFLLLPSTFLYSIVACIVL